MDSKRLTIIPSDKTVYRDQGVQFDLDFSNCGIPANVHALQWFDGNGEIEYEGNVPNDTITELPAWALACVALWEQAYNTTPPTVVNP